MRYWNRLELRYGDYKTIAHIAPDRTVTYYEDGLPEDVRAHSLTQNGDNLTVFVVLIKKIQHTAVAVPNVLTLGECPSSLIETERGYAVWDDVQGGIYVDSEGVQEEFTSEWQAEDYLKQIKQAEAERSAGSSADGRSSNRDIPSPQTQPRRYQVVVYHHIEKNRFCFGPVGIQCFFSFFKGIKTARCHVGKTALFIIAIMIIKLAVGVLEDNNAFLVE